MLKLGCVLTDANDSELFWDGTRQPQPAVPPVIDTYDDHRMALALAPVSMRQPLVINNPNVVSKSYPNFWHDLLNAGFSIEEKSEA